jgi:hypothetical protein
VWPQAGAEASGQDYCIHVVGSFPAFARFARFAINAVLFPANTFTRFAERSKFQLRAADSLDDDSSVVTAVSLGKGKHAMRRWFITFTALTLLGAFLGCRHVGGVCDCYDYGCYPPCYGPCATGKCGMLANGQGGGCRGGGCGGCGGCGGAAAPAGVITEPVNTAPNGTAPKTKTAPTTDKKL